MLEIITNFWVIQFIGIIALVFVIFAWSAKTREKIIKSQSINLILFTFHYILLGAHIAALMCVIVLFRNFVFVKKGTKKWASHPTWFYFFCLISAFGLILSWKGLITILPVLAVILGTYGMYKEKPSDMRFYNLINCLMWIPYTIVVSSYSGLMSQIVGIIGISIGMYKHDRKEIMPE
jgi:hypothetical protein